MTVWSARLGEIGDDAFASAVSVAGVGAFLSASPVSGGLFGQNVYLSTTMGDYVFRGAPHWHNGGPNDDWQFPKERFYADLLHAETAAPVAWPQHLGRCDAFPWPWLITPRLPGLSLADPAVRAGLTRTDHAAIARAMGEMLAALQALTRPEAGDFDPALQDFAPYQGGYAGHLVRMFERHGGSARDNGRFGDSDSLWLSRLLQAGLPGDGEGPAVFAHNDFSLGNVLVDRTGGGWRVSGVIDLMTADFGDPAADLPRLACQYLDTAPAMAAEFIGAWKAAAPQPRPSADRVALLVALERLLIWDYFTRPGTEPELAPGQDFTAWAGGYIDRVLALL